MASLATEGHILPRDDMPSRGSVRTGMALSAFVVLFLAIDAAGKLLMPDVMIAHSPAIGIPADAGFYRLLGTILALCVALYAWPPTAALGAVLLTGYLGGAVATHLIAGSPLFGSTLFGVYVGSFVWAGLWLRDPHIRQLFTVRA